MRSIRVMTSAEREAREARSLKRYARIYGDVMDEFGEQTRDSLLHAETVRRVEREQQDDAADAAEYRASGMA